MEFLILGPLEARAGGHGIALGGAKQRGLLALLLLHRNEVVSTDRLIDGLWGATPPATALKVVQVYVSRLRRVLGESGHDPGRLVTRPPGYRLAVGPDELDLDRFEAQVERAGLAMARGDPAVASEALRLGLAIWRGRPLADLAFEPFAQTAAARLEEQRLAALESRIEADLALGRAPRLIGELGSLVDEHPLRERLRSCLVLALYRAGRQAEALEAYRAARRALVDELGIEPSPELAELEGAILRHDPVLALPTPAPAAAAPALPGPPPPAPAPRRAQESERKHVTVLSCDIVDSSTVMERLGAEAMHELLARFHDLARAEVDRYGGTVSRLSADGFTALIGAPVAHEDHALRAVLTALGLRRRLAEGALAGHDPSPPIRVRMGLDSGLVVLGSMGGGGPPAATGETVVVAERLQRLAPPGAILASEATAGLVAGAVRLEPVGVRVEEPGAPVRTHRVVGMGPQRSPLAGLDALPAGRFVGREPLLAALADAMAQVREGRGQVVGIVGEPGMGKSRLVRELRRSLSGERITVTEGRCLSYGSSTPYLPVRDHIRATCGITEGDGAGTVAEKLSFALDEIGLDPEKQAPLLLQLLGAEEPTEAPAGLTPEAVKAHTFQTLVQMALNGSRRRPLVLVYEDLHWVDTLTEELLTSLADGLHGAAVLLLCTYRPGYRAPWLGLSYARQLSLQPLSAAESADVIRGALGGDELPERLADIVVARAEGNPFFAEELARAFRDGRGEGIAIPGTVRDVLAARIDLLPDAPRRLLRTASVIGREFTPRLLEPLWEEGSPVERELAQLTRLEFVYERIDADGPRYVFAHALTHEVAYDGLLLSTRRAVHMAVGRMLEVEYADRPDEVVDRLAHHYSRTDDSAKAVQYLSRSAAKNVQSYAHAEAVQALEVALPHAERLPAGGRERCVLALVVRLGESLYFNGRFEACRALLLGYRPRLDALGDPRLAGEFYFWLATIYNHVGAASGAEGFATRAIQEAGRAGDGATAGRARIILAWEGFFTGRHAEGAAHARAAVAALEPTEDWWWLSYALGWAAVNQLSLGAFDAALALVERSRSIGHATRDPRLRSYGAWMRGRVRAMRSDWEPAIADLEDSIAFAPDPLNRAYAMGWLGFAHRENGDHERAIAVLEEAIGSMAGFDFQRVVCVFRGFLAGAYRAAGRIDDAREASEGALAHSRSLGYPWSAALALRERGRVDLAAGDLAGAERRLSEALATFDGMEAVVESAVARLDLAELCIRRGQREAAERHLEICRARFAAAGARAYADRAESLARRLVVA